VTTGLRPTAQPVPAKISGKALQPPYVPAASSAPSEQAAPVAPPPPAPIAMRSGEGQQGPPTAAPGSATASAPAPAHELDQAAASDKGEQLAPSVYGVRILALAAYRPVLTAAAACSLGSASSAPYHLTQLRCAASCVLAACEEGPAGPRSASAQHLGQQLQAADPGAWWALCADSQHRLASASVLASVEDAAMLVLGDGSALQAVFTSTQGHTALRLDVPQLEQAAMRAAVSALRLRSGASAACVPYK
jgi:hypothetical protein